MNLFHADLYMTWFVHTENVLPDDLKLEAKSVSCTLQPLVEGKHDIEITGLLNAISVFDKVSPANMAEE